MNLLKVDWLDAWDEYKSSTHYLRCMSCNVDGRMGLGPELLGELFL